MHGEQSTRSTRIRRMKNEWRHYGSPDNPSFDQDRLWGKVCFIPDATRAHLIDIQRR